MNINAFNTIFLLAFLAISVCGIPTGPPPPDARRQANNVASFVPVPQFSTTIEVDIFKPGPSPRCYFSYSAPQGTFLGQWVATCSGRINGQGSNACHIWVSNNPQANNWVYSGFILPPPDHAGIPVRCIAVQSLVNGQNFRQVVSAQYGNIVGGSGDAVVNIHNLTDAGVPSAVVQTWGDGTYTGISDMELMQNGRYAPSVKTVFVHTAVDASDPVPQPITCSPKLILEGYRWRQATDCFETPQTVQVVGGLYTDGRGAVVSVSSGASSPIEEVSTGYWLHWSVSALGSMISAAVPTYIGGACIAMVSSASSATPGMGIYCYAPNPDRLIHRGGIADRSILSVDFFGSASLAYMYILLGYNRYWTLYQCPTDLDFSITRCTLQHNQTTTGRVTHFHTVYENNVWSAAAPTFAFMACVEVTPFSSTARAIQCTVYTNTTGSIIPTPTQSQRGPTRSPSITPNLPSGFGTIGVTIGARPDEANENFVIVSAARQPGYPSHAENYIPWGETQQMRLPASTNGFTWYLSGRVLNTDNDPCTVTFLSGGVNLPSGAYTLFENETAVVTTFVDCTINNGGSGAGGMSEDVLAVIIVFVILVVALMVYLCWRFQEKWLPWLAMLMAWCCGKNRKSKNRPETKRLMKPCEVQSCPRQALKDGPYCQLHTCTANECYLLRVNVPNSRCCQKHAQVTAEGACADVGCNNAVLNNSSLYCGDHQFDCGGCTQAGDKPIRVGENQFCIRHKHPCGECVRLREDPPYRVPRNDAFCVHHMHPCQECVNAGYNIANRVAQEDDDCGAEHKNKEDDVFNLNN